MAEQKKTSSMSDVIQALHQSNYAMFDGNKDKALSFMEQRMMAFPNYTNVVIKEQIMTELWAAKFGYGSPEYRERYQEIDRQRHFAHNDACTSISIMNNTCKKLGIAPFTDFNVSLMTIDDDKFARQQVADFAGDFCNDLYNKGIGRTDDKGRELTGMDRAAYQRRAEYDVSVPGKRMRELDAKFGDMMASGQSNETEYTA